jgi:hypothetical protein
MVVDAREPNGYTNNENINNEVMSEIYKAQIKRGLELELCIVDRLVGLVDGFEGFQLYWGKKHETNNRIGYFDKNGKGLPKKTFKQLLIEGIFPDVDTVIINQSNDVVCVVSSKGSLSDSNVYATYAHGKEWDFPLFVVTKDEKRIFASGKTKYIPLFRAAGVKVYISNHKDYDKPTESGKWENYEWCDVVSPEHILHTDIHNRILETKSENNFFNYEKHEE